MNITILQIITTFQVILWFDLFKCHNIILVALGYQKWTKKSELPFLLKPLACYFCTSFWFGVLNATILFIHTGELFLPAILIMSNTIVSRLLDFLLGYQSFKP